MADVKAGGFGYCPATVKADKRHTYVTVWKTPQKEYYVELEGIKSRKVKNPYATDKETYLIWTLITEIEKAMRTNQIWWEMEQ